MGQELRRRTGIIRVHVTIRVGTKTSADVMAGKLTSEAINDELAKQGLRAATIVEKATASEQETVNEESGNDLLLVALLCGIGGATVTIIILAIVAAFAKCCCHRKKKAKVHTEKKEHVLMEDLERASSQGVSASMSGRFDCVHTSPAGDDVDAVRANLSNDALVLPPTLSNVPSQSLSTTAEDIASDEVDDEAQGLLPGSAITVKNGAEAVRGQSRAILHSGEIFDVRKQTIATYEQARQREDDAHQQIMRRELSVDIRKQMIETHEQALQQEQDAHQIEILRREQELQRQLRMRQQKRGSLQPIQEVVGARATPRGLHGSNALLPELQHRPSAIERTQLIDEHEQALQREQRAREETTMCAEEQWQRQPSTTITSSSDDDE